VERKFPDAHLALFFTMTRFPAGTVMRITGLLISGPQSSFEWNKSRQQLFNITARAIFKSRNLKLMGKEAEYRSFAALCLEVATKPTDTAHKARLLANAEAWLNLADRVTELAKRSACKIADHPLVLKTLRRYAEVEME
jgi:hypothetical protein